MPVICPSDIGFLKIGRALNFAGWRIRRGRRSTLFDSRTLSRTLGIGQFRIMFRRRGNGRIRGRTAPDALHFAAAQILAQSRGKPFLRRGFLRPAGGLFGRAGRLSTYCHALSFKLLQPSRQAPGPRYAGCGEIAGYALFFVRRAKYSGTFEPIAGGHRPACLSRRLMRHSRLFAHDPEKLRTFRVGLCDW